MKFHLFLITPSALRQLFFCVISILSLSLFNSCSKPPAYPDTPTIELASIDNYSSADPTKEDSLIININFKDGDGDLGLRSEDINYPYQTFDYKKDAMGNYIKKGASGTPIYPNCKFWLIGLIDNDAITDTVWIEPNLYHNNFIIDIYIKQMNGTYQLYDVSNICPDFNGRFPLLNSLDNVGPIEGAIHYSLRDVSNFSGSTLKFKIYIIDRALRKSNVVESGDIFIN